MIVAVRATLYRLNSEKCAMWENENTTQVYKHASEFYNKRYMLKLCLSIIPLTCYCVGFSVEVTLLKMTHMILLGMVLACLCYNVQGSWPNGPSFDEGMYSQYYLRVKKQPLATLDNNCIHM